VRGNDGKTRISVPEEMLARPVSPPDSPSDRPSVSPGDSPPDKLIKALEAHVATLKEQLAAAEARIDKQADDLVAYDAAYAAGLSAERAKVEAERAKAEQALAAAEARAEKQASDFAARDARQAADLDAERARTERAIAAFAALVERLDAGRSAPVVVASADRLMQQMQQPNARGARGGLGLRPTVANRFAGVGGRVGGFLGPAFLSRPREGHVRGYARPSRRRLRGCRYLPPSAITGVGSISAIVARAARHRSLTSRRKAIVSAERPPCRQLLRLPRGAPPPAPCM
jgi:hypothetical protein